MLYNSLKKRVLSTSKFDRPRFIQKLITSYYLIYGRHPSYHDLSRETQLLLTTIDSYVSKILEFKQGNIAFYLGLCNIVPSSPNQVIRSSEALFGRAIVGGEDSGA